ncbi:MBL fold hydrolase [Kordiimonas sediminis]|uniref:MBL fold hydrolase n=1 Tax=Kordiimonas sediminis TaxID=1735581 RepID=A0A919AXT8_9PROT|nr:ribonuclease J [Kordiimonas sediminis]GHF28608.1 MBL fold hydrolase [Kordiimonas sediminis]
MSYMKKNDDRVLFLPLGGSGEIGMNLNLYGHKGRWLMVDCGMSFADDHLPGIDLVFPRVDFIEDEQDALVGLVLTHGHEDHIGAIPYLWEKFRCPVYATPFTAELVKDKLKEAGLLDQVDLIVVEPSVPQKLGPFEVTYVPLAHSIAEGHGVAIKTSKGTLFHTGDWKLDDRPLIGPVCPSPVLQKLGEDGVLCLIGDSTNVFNESESGSEAAVRESLQELVKGVKQRLVITTFASNVARLDTIGQLAKATGRHLVLLGRSMHRIYNAAKETGYLKDFPPLMAEEDADHLPRDRVLIACTGCQGEHRAAISRIARDDHKFLHLAAGDTVIFSSKIIPGNEITLGRLFNELADKGVEVITEKDAFIHVSGHPGRAELRKMYDWVRPASIIPVHGETRHLIRHAAFAREMGLKKTIVPKNGDIIEISTSGVKKIDEVAVGRLILDGKLVEDIGSEPMIERRRMAVNGHISASLIFGDRGEALCEPLLSIRGVPGGHTDIFYDTVLETVERALERMSPKKRQNDKDVEEVARIAIRRFCRQETGKNPSVDILITRREDLSI